MRHKHSHLTRHHRRPKALGGKNSKENISHITAVEHEAWHTLFGCLSPELIADKMNRGLLDPAYTCICITKKEAQRTQLRYFW